MKLAGRIPVEPLDEERLTNIERRVVAGAVDAALRQPRAPGPRRAGRWLAVAAIAAAVVAGWLVRGAPDAARAVVAGPPPIRVETAGPSRLDLGDATIDAGPATAFVVSRPDGGVLVALARGKVELEVAKRGARPPLVVRAGETDVVVVGTRFTVDYGDGRGDVDVQVRDGAVSVVHQREATRVAAGQAWQRRTGLVALADDAAARGPATGERGAPRAAAGAASFDDRSDARPAPAAPLATPVAEPRGTKHQPAGDGSARARDRAPLGPVPDVLRGRTTVVPEAPSSRAPASTAPARGSATRTVPASPGVVRATASEPVIELRTALRAQPIEPALDIGEPSATAAIAKYYGIAAHRSGDQASQAFYSIAVVSYLRLAHNADALQTLDAYTHRFPGGKEVRAVLWLRVRILCLDKIDDRCRAAAYTYLHEAPDGDAARVAERLTLTE
jgi:hypothetical protein